MIEDALSKGQQIVEGEVLYEENKDKTKTNLWTWNQLLYCYPITPKVVLAYLWSHKPDEISLNLK